MLTAAVTALIKAANGDAVAAAKAEVEKVKLELASAKTAQATAEGEKATAEAQRDTALADDAQVAALTDDLDKLANLAAAAIPPSQTQVEAAAAIDPAPVS